MDMPTDDTPRAQQRTRYVALALKHHARAALTGDPGVADTHIRLANGYIKIADTLAKLDRFQASPRLRNGALG